jgi:hypothetical protein
MEYHIQNIVIIIIGCMAFFLMTVITLRLTALPLALYRKPSTNFNAPPPITHDVLIPAWL